MNSVFLGAVELPSRSLFLSLVCLRCMSALPPWVCVLSQSQKEWCVFVLVYVISVSFSSEVPESWWKCLLFSPFDFPGCHADPSFPLYLLCCGKFLVWGLLYFCYFLKGNVMQWTTDKQPLSQMAEQLITGKYAMYFTLYYIPIYNTKAM